MTVQGRYNNFAKGASQSSKEKKCMDRWSRSLTELNDDEHEFTDIPLNIDQEIGTPNLGSPKSTGRVTIGN